MGIFFEKPSKGPDVTGGGVWPIRDTAKLWNRSGAAKSKGDVVQLALTPGAATEIATNDANSYIPGASNDTVWNTFINAISSTTTGSSINRGGVFGVVMDDNISDNKAGRVCLFGLVEAFVRRANTTSTNPGSPLTITPSNSVAAGFTFNPVIASNQKTVATLMGFSNALLTTKRLRKVFLHQGLFGGMNGQTLV